MERGRESEACPSGELQEGGSRDGTPESTEGEEGGPGNQAITTLLFYLIE